MLRRVPGVREALAEQIVGVVQTLRKIDFYKRPGIAETLDWTRALLGLKSEQLYPELLQETAGVLLKHRDDIDRLRTIGAARVLAGDVEAQAESEKLWR